MIKNKIRNNKGITLTSLVITVIALILITGIIIYNLKDNLKVKNLQRLQNDISNLRDKISSYYMKTGSIPAKGKYTNTNHINTISSAVDTGDFLVIDLAAIDNLTLNYGKDYKKVRELDSFKSGTTLTNEEMEQYKDLYIINEASQNIFYVAGVNIDKEMYYTDYTVEDIDKKAVDFRYIDGVQIPEGFSYVSGTKDTGIIIKNNDNAKQYNWIVKDSEITEVPSDIEITAENRWNFIESVNHYKGYYKSINSNDVIYLSIDNFSPKYDKEGIYNDKNGDTAYIPKDFCVSTTPGENTISEGLVAKDSNNNEWVWIRVPKTIMPSDLYFNDEEDYTIFIQSLKKYADPYTKGSNEQNFNWKDEWYAIDTDGTTVMSAETESLTEEQKQLNNGCGLNYYEYEENYKKMLKSVYEKGGFWIGRYEAGIEGSIEDVSLGRTSNKDTTAKVISQKNAIPYNFVSCSKAQELASEMSLDENKTSSLMFGIQWDLVCKFVEEQEIEKQGKEQKTNIEESINSNSKNWGNYKDVNLLITSNNAKGYSYTDKIWSNISGTKINTLISSGASNNTKKLNIYDLAGNECEWTLEYVTENNDEGICSLRGGDFINDSRIFISKS